PPIVLSSIVIRPGRSGYLDLNFAAETLLTGRQPYWPKMSCATVPFVNWMNLFATSLFALFLSTAIGSWISIVWRGITYWMSWPASFDVIASLSYVSRTSPRPERNVFVALRPDVSCETTCSNSFLTYACACASDLPRCL